MRHTFTSAALVFLMLLSVITTVTPVQADIGSWQVWTDKPVYTIGETVTIHVKPTPALGVFVWLLVSGPDGSQVRLDLATGDYVPPRDTATIPAGPLTGLYRVELWGQEIYEPPPPPELAATCHFEVRSTETVEIKVWSLPIELKGQDPSTIPLEADLHASIWNSQQKMSYPTIYSFQAPVNTQLRLVVDLSPSDRTFADWWDDYGASGQLNAETLTINVGTVDHKICAFFTLLQTVEIKVWSLPLELKGQDPTTVPIEKDLHAYIFNSAENRDTVTIYGFRVPVGAHVDFYVKSTPEGWTSANWWDDYGHSGQSNTSMLPIVAGNEDRKIVAFFTRPPACPGPSYPSDRWDMNWYVYTDDPRNPQGACIGTGQLDSGIDPHALNFNKDFGYGGVSGRIDFIYLVMSRTVVVQAGTYTFKIGGDDGVRLSIDGQIPNELDGWKQPQYYTEYSYTITHDTGTTLKLKLEWFEQHGAARVSFSMTQGICGFSLVIMPSESSLHPDWGPRVPLGTETSISVFTRLGEVPVDLTLESPSGRPSYLGGITRPDGVYTVTTSPDEVGVWMVKAEVQDCGDSALLIVLGHDWTTVSVSQLVEMKYHPGDELVSTAVDQIRAKMMKEYERYFKSPSHKFTYYVTYTDDPKIPANLACKKCGGSFNYANNEMLILIGFAIDEWMALVEHGQFHLEAFDKLAGARPSHELMHYFEDEYWYDDSLADFFSVYYSIFYPDVVEGIAEYTRRQWYSTYASAEYERYFEFMSCVVQNSQTRDLTLISRVLDETAKSDSVPGERMNDGFETATGKTLGEWRKACNVPQENRQLLLLEESGMKLHLHVYDDQGRHVGYSRNQGGVEIQIPGAEYHDLGKSTVIGLPGDIHSFRLIIDATEAETSTEHYRVSVYCAREQIVVDTVDSRISKGDVRKYRVDTSEGVRISEETAGVDALPMIIAALAGLTVVALLFVVKRRAGSRRTTGSSVAAGPPGRSLVGKKYCINCGASIPAEARYCTSCGFEHVWGKPDW